VKNLPDSLYEAVDDMSRPCTACGHTIKEDTLFFMHVSDTAGFCSEKCVEVSRKGIENLDEMLDLLEEGEAV